MTTTNTTEPQNWREYRRLRVWEMHQQGHRQQAIADALGLTQGAVSQIIARAETSGVGALGRCLDLRAHCPTDCEDLWHQLSPGLRRSAAAAGGLECAATHRAGNAV
jgi:hypothetical protein